MTGAPLSRGAPAYRSASIPESHHISVVIDRPAREVAAFLANAENWPRWASGLGDTFQRTIAGYRIVLPDGAMTLTICEPNVWGIFDHWVTPDGGAPMYNPMRVIEHGAGAEVIFTLIRHPGITDDDYDRDRNWVKRDLATLKRRLEEKPA